MTTSVTTTYPQRKVEPVRARLAGDVVGIGDIARRCTDAGYPVTEQTVQSWRIRATRRTARSTRVPMPLEDGMLSGYTPWWWWSTTVEPWLMATGRLPTTTSTATSMPAGTTSTPTGKDPE